MNGRRGALLVVGATGGIGSSVVARETPNYQTIVLLHRCESTRAVELAQLVEKGGATPFELICDVAEPASVDDAVTKIEARLDRLDGIVFAAAKRIARKPTLRIPWEEFETEFQLQVGGVHHTLSRGTALLHTGTKIVLILTSALHRTPPSRMTAYYAAKAALWAYGRALAVELLRRSIVVHLISPGMTRTELISDLPDAYIAEHEKNLPGGRILTPEQIAGAVSFLLSDDSTALAGAPIVASGGEVI